MDKSTFNKIKEYAKEQSIGIGHDFQHSYRVLGTALEIAKHEENIDYDVLITACILHDIGRAEELQNSNLCHAKIGAQKAYEFLLKNNWSEKKADHVKNCILTHRGSSDTTPESTEAKILFDADKIDIIGATGIARILLYLGSIDAPIYTLNDNDSVNDGTDTDELSFFKAYKTKYEHITDKLFTRYGRELAKHRQHTSNLFYSQLFHEANTSVNNVDKHLDKQFTCKNEPEYRKEEPTNKKTTLRLIRPEDRPPQMIFWLG